MSKLINQSEEVLPKTLNEAVDILLKEVPYQDRVIIRNCRSKRDLIFLHNSLGQIIRNEFKLWGGNKALANDISPDLELHPDSISMLIIENFWTKLRSEE